MIVGSTSYIKALYIKNLYITFLNMKNTFIWFAVTGLLSLASCGQKFDGHKNSSDSTKTSAKNDTAALVCKLTSEEKMKRSEELKNTLFKEYEKLNEFPEAVELVYADAKKYAPLLVEFINSERDCCPFFTFNLKFEPNSEKVSLTIGGSARIKEMIKSMME